jgi:hypothetical protein
MLKKLLISLVLLPIFSMAESPDWVKSKPTGYINDYRLCYSIGDKDFKSGEQRALESCIKEISSMDGMYVGETKTEYSRTNERLEVKSNLKYKIEPTKINFEIREKYFGYNSSNEKESYLLVSYPKKQVIALPSMSELTIKQLTFPGWAELSIGESYKGQLRAFNSAFLLIGALTAFSIMHDAYGDSRDSRNIDDRRIYRQKADFYRNWCVGFSLTYIIHSVYTTMDIRHSDYLQKYL